jgi:uncharacterized DUF497 family protein
MASETTPHDTIAALVARCEGFEWDEGNRSKNWISHKVKEHETEEVFLGRPLRFSDDFKHSQAEPRYLALGKTIANRLLFLSFTIRGAKIRVISARDMNDKDKTRYAGEEA